LEIPAENPRFSTGIFSSRWTTWPLVLIGDQNVALGLITEEGGQVMVILPKMIK